MLPSLHYVMRIFQNLHSIPYQSTNSISYRSVSQLVKSVRCPTKLTKVRVLLVIHILSFSLANKMLPTLIFLVDLQQNLYVISMYVHV